MAQIISLLSAIDFLSAWYQLRSQDSASSIETEAGEQAERWGGAEEKLDMSCSLP